MARKWIHSGRIGNTDVWIFNTNIVTSSITNFLLKKGEKEIALYLGIQSDTMIDEIVKHIRNRYIPKRNFKLVRIKTEVLELVANNKQLK